MKTRLGINIFQPGELKLMPWRFVSPFYTFSEYQPKDIEDKACPEVYVKVQEYVLFLEYFKLIVSCSRVQKKSKKQKEIFYLVDPKTLQNKTAKTIF